MSQTKEDAALNSSTFRFGYLDIIHINTLYEQLQVFSSKTPPFNPLGSSIGSFSNEALVYYLYNAITSNPVCS